MDNDSLFSQESLLNAKEKINSLMRDFIKVEPGNTLVIPETKKGLAIIDEAFAKLGAMGYSHEDSQLLANEVVETLINEVKRSPASSPIRFKDENF